MGKDINIHFFFFFQGQLTLFNNIVFSLDLDTTKQYKLSEGEIRAIIYWCGGETTTSESGNSFDEDYFINSATTCEKRVVRLVRKCKSSTERVGNSVLQVISGIHILILLDAWSHVYHHVLCNV